MLSSPSMLIIMKNFTEGFGVFPSAAGDRRRFEVFLQPLLHILPWPNWWHHHINKWIIHWKVFRVSHFFLFWKYVKWESLLRRKHLILFFEDTAVSSGRDSPGWQSPSSTNQVWSTWSPSINDKCLKCKCLVMTTYLLLERWYRDIFSSDQALVWTIIISYISSFSHLLFY